MACDSAEPLMGRESIEARIPHRAPFLFVTRVIEMDANSITTEWDVDPSAPFFAGHYPDNPIVPGVLLSEFVFQSAAIQISATLPDELSVAAVPVLTRIQDARFKSMVGPGETLRAEITLEERLGPACYMLAKVTCEDRNVLRIKFCVALSAPKPATSESSKGIAL